MNALLASANSCLTYATVAHAGWSVLFGSQSSGTFTDGLKSFTGFFQEQPDQDAFEKHGVLETGNTAFNIGATARNALQTALFAFGGRKFALPLLAWEAIELGREVIYRDGDWKDLVLDVPMSLLQIGALGTSLMTGKGALRGYGKYNKLRSTCLEERKLLRGNKSPEAMARKAELKGRLNSLREIAHKNHWDNRSGGFLGVLGESAASTVLPGVREFTKGWNRFASAA